MRESICREKRYDSILFCSKGPKSIKDYPISDYKRDVVLDFRKSRVFQSKWRRRRQRRDARARAQTHQRLTPHNIPMR